MSQCICVRVSVSMRKYRRTCVLMYLCVWPFCFLKHLRLVRIYSISIYLYFFTHVCECVYAMHSCVRAYAWMYICMYICMYTAFFQCMRTVSYLPIVPGSVSAQASPDDAEERSATEPIDEALAATWRGVHSLNPVREIVTGQNAATRLGQRQSKVRALRRIPIFFDYAKSGLGDKAETGKDCRCRYLKRVYLRRGMCVCVCVLVSLLSISCFLFLHAHTHKHTRI